MRDFRDAKAMAQTLREALKTKSVSITHSESLELIARSFGLPDWNVLAAKIQAEPAAVSSVTPPSVAVAASMPAMPPRAGTPILPIRDLVIFPQMVVPVFVGRDKTKRAIERAVATDGRILVVTQRRATDDDPALDALYSVGVIASVIHSTTLLDGTFKLFISGHDRSRVVGPSVEAQFLAAEVAPLEPTNGHGAEAVVLFRTVLEAYQRWANVDFSAMPQGPQARLRLPSMEEPGALADAIAPLLPIGIEQKQQLLETADVVARLEAILDLMKSSQHAA